MLRCRRSWTAGHKLWAIIGKIFTLPASFRLFPILFPMSTSTFHIVHFEVRTLTFRCQIDSRCRLRATCIAIYTSRQKMSQTLQKNLMNKYAADLMLFSNSGNFAKIHVRVTTWPAALSILGGSAPTTWEQQEKQRDWNEQDWNFCVFWKCHWVAAARYTVSPVQPNVWATVVPVTLARGTILNKPSFLCLTTGLQRCLLQDRQDPHISDRWPRSHRWSGENPMKTYLSKADCINIGIFFSKKLLRSNRLQWPQFVASAGIGFMSVWPRWKPPDIS